MASLLLLLPGCLLAAAAAAQDPPAPQLFTAELVTDVSDTPIVIEVHLISWTSWSLAARLLGLWHPWALTGSILSSKMVSTTRARSSGWFLVLCSSLAYQVGANFKVQLSTELHWVTIDLGWNWILSPGSSDQNEKWLHNEIKDDPVVGSNTRGAMTVKIITFYDHDAHILFNRHNQLCHWGPRHADNSAFYQLRRQQSTGQHGLCTLWRGGWCWW